MGINTIKQLLWVTRAPENIVYHKALNCPVFIFNSMLLKEKFLNITNYIYRLCMYIQVKQEKTLIL